MNLFPHSNMSLICVVEVSYGHCFIMIYGSIHNNHMFTLFLIYLHVCQ